MGCEFVGDFKPVSRCFIHLGFFLEGAKNTTSSLLEKGSAKFAKHLKDSHALWIKQSCDRVWAYVKLTFTFSKERGRAGSRSQQVAKPIRKRPSDSLRAFSAAARAGSAWGGWPCRAIGTARRATTTPSICWVVCGTLHLLCRKDAVTWNRIYLFFYGNRWGDIHANGIFKIKYLQITTERIISREKIRYLLSGLYLLEDRRLVYDHRCFVSLLVIMIVELLFSWCFLMDLMLASSAFLLSSPRVFLNYKPLFTPLVTGGLLNVRNESGSWEKLNFFNKSVNLK